MDKKIVIIVGIGCAILCLLLVVALGLGVWLFSRAAQSPTDIDVIVDTPASVNIGDEFVIRVTITNKGQQARELNSIDIYTSYLDGVVIQRTLPAYDEFSNNLFGDFHSYYFYGQIPPGSTTTVQFFARAVLSGDFSGDLDVCIDSGIRCTSYFIRTIIRD